MKPGGEISIFFAFHEDGIRGNTHLTFLPKNHQMQQGGCRGWGGGGAWLNLPKKTLLRLFSVAVHDRRRWRPQGCHQPPGSLHRGPRRSQGAAPPLPPPGTTKYSTIFSISLETRWHPRTHQLGGEWGGVREGWGVGGGQFSRKGANFLQDLH